MFNNLIGKNKELGRFLFCERYTLPPVKNAMYIAEGQDLKRGAVVDVNGVLVGTNSLMPYAVLEFDCDTRSGGKEASVFIKGKFNFDKLHFADGLEKSDLDNIVYNGNGLGIVIKPYEYAEGFSPLMVQQSSNIAPNYTKTTYEANSYVMQEGVLYTNQNAIGTAEDWNPAHWTQTTVAEMVSSAGPTPYTNTTESFTMTSSVTKTVGNREAAVWNITSPSGGKNLTVNCSDDCAIYIYKNGQDININLLDENGNALNVVRTPAPYVYSETESVEVDGSEYTFVTDCYIDPDNQGSYFFIRVIGKIALMVESETRY